MKLGEWHKTKHPGVYVKHNKVRGRGGTVRCPGDPAVASGRCKCERSWRVRYRDEKGAPRWSRTYKTEAEARSWQTDKDKRKRMPEASASDGRVQRPGR